MTVTRVNISVPEALADQMRAAGVPVSAVCQRALRTELGRATYRKDPDMAITTLKMDWDDSTIAAVRVACLAVADVYEAMGSNLPGPWNLADAARLRTAAGDMAAYVETREAVKQSQVIRALLGRQGG